MSKKVKKNNIPVVYEFTKEQRFNLLFKYGFKESDIPDRAFKMESCLSHMVYYVTRPFDSKFLIFDCSLSMEFLEEFYQYINKESSHLYHFLAYHPEGDYFILKHKKDINFTKLANYKKTWEYGFLVEVNQYLSKAFFKKIYNIRIFFEGKNNANTIGFNGSTRNDFKKFISNLSELEEITPTYTIEHGDSLEVITSEVKNHVHIW